MFRTRYGTPIYCRPRGGVWGGRGRGKRSRNTGFRHTKHSLHGTACFGPRVLLLLLPYMKTSPRYFVHPPPAPVVTFFWCLGSGSAVWSFEQIDRNRRADLPVTPSFSRLLFFLRCSVNQLAPYIGCRRNGRDRLWVPVAKG